MRVVYCFAIQIRQNVVIHLYLPHRHTCSPVYTHRRLQHPIQSHMQLMRVNNPLAIKPKQIHEILKMSIRIILSGRWLRCSRLPLSRNNGRRAKRYRICLCMSFTYASYLCIGLSASYDRLRTQESHFAVALREQSVVLFG